MTAVPCPRCASPLEPGDLRCALCGQAAPDVRAQRETLEVEILRCDGCGAAVSYDATAGAPRCAFCGSELRVERQQDPQEQTEWYLPFTVTADQAQAGLKQWLGSRGFFRPADLRAASRLAGLQPTWWVGWVFDAQALVSWTADSDVGSRRSAWAPHSGQTRMAFERIAVSASRGLELDETLALTSSYDLGTARSEPEGPDHARVEQFDVQRSLARARILRVIDGLSAARVESGCVPGSRVRHVHTATLLHGLTTHRYAFPAWVLAYRYRDRLYRAVVSGQDARVVTGAAPWSWLRILLVAGLGALALAAVLAALFGS